MELSCGPLATAARHTRNDTTRATKGPPKAARRAVAVPARDGRPGSWSDWLGRVSTSDDGLVVVCQVYRSVTAFKIRTPTCQMSTGLT
jgi:hypothetical protein